MKKGIIPVVVMAVVLAIAGACVNLESGTSPATRFYLLESRSEAPPAWSLDKPLAGTAIGMGPIRIPAYLDRPQIVTRLNGWEIKADDFNRWAEPLKASIPRLIGENLLSLSSGSHLRMFPWNQSAHIDFQVAGDIHQFEADATGRVILKAVWRIVSPDNHRLLVEHQSTITKRSAGAGVGDRVEGMSSALSDLSLEIARHLIEVNRTQNAHATPET